jgi:hypothetical protein
VLGAIVIGMEVVMVEPCALVVVTFANEVVGAPALLLLLLCGAERSLDGKDAVARDGVAGPCAVEGVAERGRRKTRRREGKGIMASWREKEGWSSMEHGPVRVLCRCQVPAFVDNDLGRAGGGPCYVLLG